MAEELSSASRGTTELGSSTLEDFFENGTVGLHLVGGDGVILKANRAELSMLGYEAEEYVGHPIADFHADRHVIDDILSRLGRGETLDKYPARLKRKDGGIREVLISSSALFRDGAFVHTRCFTVDVTEQRAAESSYRETEARLRALSENLPNGMIYQIAVSQDGARKFTYVSNGCERLHGVSADEAKSDPDALYGLIHPDDLAGLMAAEQAALAAGSAFDHEVRMRRREGAYRWYRLTSAHRTVAGGDTLWDGIQVDIDNRKQAEQGLRGSEAYLRNLLDSTAEAFYAVDTDGTTTLCNRAFLNMLGFEREEDAVGRKLHDVIHHSHPDGSHYAKADCPVYRGASTGEPAHVSDELFFKLDGSSFPVEYRVSPLFDGGELRGAICTFVDISERQAADRALRETESELRSRSEALQVLNRAGATVAADVDVSVVVQTVTDAGVELTGAQFGAFFYNVLNEAGESFTLYTLAGVPREAFAKFPMPRNTAIFAPTFNGDGTVRSDDITKDPRYGHNAPYRGMPEGHLPVRSYLAVPVRSRTGEVLGGLFFGHAETAVFDARAEELMAGLAAQASVAIDNARLYQAAQWEIGQRRKAEEDLQQLNATLESRIAEEVERRAKAEDALRQAQKMEAVGQLTGGVAHDFNNLLTVIIGGIDTIKRSQPDDEVRIQRAADMALQGAQRAASLTSRLLAFSRRQPLAPQPSDLNLVMRSMTELLHRTLGETVELEGVLAPRLWTVDVDQNQLESAILNLALNARDAMPEGGRLTIETANAALDQGYVDTDAEVIPGQYVMVSVSDTGAGMDKATLERVFEPFFTTKEVGKGTGLGLSMIYGFVKQSGGHVTLYSEPGEGTSVKLYFPRFFGEHPNFDHQNAALAPIGHREEVILIVEDNPDVRAYSVMVLTELGYTVLEAEDVESALQVLEKSGQIDLLFTDVVLPGRSGRVLADLAQVQRPGLKVLFTTGYSRNAIVHQGRLDAGVELISKPFTFEQLAARVRDVLDMRARP